jgi:hypothetical protein
MKPTHDFLSFLLENQLQDAINREKGGKLFGKDRGVTGFHPSDDEVLIVSEGFFDQHLILSSHNAVNLI